jgi:hypothetical protein
MGLNTVITPQVIAKVALPALKANSRMLPLVHKEFRSEWMGKKVGQTVQIRKPVLFEGHEGADITNSIEQVTETYTDLTIQKELNVAWEFSARDLNLSVDEYSKRYILPAVATLGRRVDLRLTNLYKGVFNASGTAGSTPSTFAALGSLNEKMSDFSVPDMGRHLLVNQKATWALQDAMKGLYSPEAIKDFVIKGVINQLAGMDIYQSQNVRRHTRGTATGTPLTNGADQSGSELVTDGWTGSVTGILKEGDIITLGSSSADYTYSVNPGNLLTNEGVAQFVVTADVDSDSSGNATIPIYPSIISTGAYKTVDANVGDGVAINVLDSHTANLAFNKNAFALAMIPQELPDSATFKARNDYEGMSIRVVKAFDIITNKEIIRLDVLMGCKCIYPEMACRLLG